MGSKDAIGYLLFHQQQLCFACFVKLILKVGDTFTCEFVCMEGFFLLHKMHDMYFFLLHKIHDKKIRTLPPLSPKKSYVSRFTVVVDLFQHDMDVFKEDTVYQVLWPNYAAELLFNTSS